MLRVLLETNENDAAYARRYPCPITLLYHTRYVYDFTLAQYFDYVNTYDNQFCVIYSIAFMHGVVYTLWQAP